MKSPLFIFLLIAVSFYAFSPPETIYKKKEDRKKFYQSIGLKYSSAPIQEIFNSDIRDNFDSYTDGYSEIALINSYSTVIHELLHSYNVQENGGNNYYINKDIQIFVPFGKYFRSKELNNYVRKGIQDSVFRYGIYVGASKEFPANRGKSGINKTENSEAFSIGYGFCGLMEEYNAYYYGTQAIFELYPYYLENYGKANPSAWKDYRHEVMSDLTAYYEFNLFFAWYMLYAKEKHPDVYQDIMNNKALRVTFTLLEAKYSKLVEQVTEQMITVNQTIGPDMLESLEFDGSDEDLFQFLEMAGMDPTAIYKEENSIVNGKNIIVKKSVMSKEVYTQMKAVYDDTYKQIKKAVGNELMLFFAQTTRMVSYMKKLYTEDVLNQLDMLRIKGLTEQNYQQYLK